MRSLVSRAVVVALMVEFVDELVDGTKSGALPLMRHSLGLSYAQVGLLFSIPMIVGSLVELPMGVLAGYGSRRRRAVLAGGGCFVVAVTLMAVAASFGVLLAAFLLFFPASGAFVSLTEATLMDAATGDQERRMAAWTVAGSLGALAGPIVVVVAVQAGMGWRAAFAVAAASGCVALVAAARFGTGTAADSTEGNGSGWGGVRAAIRTPGVIRWLLLLPVADLMLDVLTGFLAVYFVDVVHTSTSVAAGAIAIRTAAGLVGEAVVMPAVDRFRGVTVLTAAVAVTAVAYPAMLVVPGVAPKLVALGVVSLTSGPLYPILQAQLYRSLPGDSAIVVSLSSAAALVGGAGPLAVGLLASRLGLAAAMAALGAVPVVLLLAVAGRQSGPNSGPNSGPKSGLNTGGHRADRDTGP